MLKIEEFAEQHFGITLLPAQLEIIAMLTANPEEQFIIERPAKSSGKTTAYKIAMAYLQDGLSVAPDTTAQNIDKLITALPGASHLTPRLQNAIAGYLEYQTKPPQYVRDLNINLKGICKGFKKETEKK